MISTPGANKDDTLPANGTAIVQSILAMAGHGSPCMQGYLFHRPMPLDQSIGRLAASTLTAAA